MTNQLAPIKYDPYLIAESNASREAMELYVEHRFGDGPAWFAVAEKLAYRALLREEQIRELIAPCQVVEQQHDQQERVHNQKLDDFIAAKVLQCAPPPACVSEAALIQLRGVFAELMATAQTAASAKGGQG